ncbi:MAG: hypothetical protein IPL43_02020 [Micropruina sp.]|nr:hypothetical protein [Micropruina sp.]
MSFFAGSHLAQSAVAKIRSVPEATLRLNVAGAMSRTHATSVLLVAVTVNTCLAPTLTDRKPATVSAVERGSQAIGPVGVATGASETDVDGLGAGAGADAVKEGGLAAATGTAVVPFGLTIQIRPSSTMIAPPTTIDRRIQ